MQKTITWRGLENDTVENCTINPQPDRVTVSSEITGPNISVHYKIETNANWLTTSCELRGHTGKFNFNYQFERGRNGVWFANGQADDRFQHCDFVDISLTPFTNTLPINRLGLAENETAEIRVVYFDFSENVIRPVAQRYTRLSANVYHYENVPNDFEADIEVDDHGFVVHYPGLFERLSTSIHLTIDGSAIHDIPSFYDEINRVFMPGEDWQLGPSLDALDDLLYGGFGVAKDAERLEIKWLHIGKTREALGYGETRKYYLAKLKPGSPFDKSIFETKLNELENGTGQTYFDLVMQVFNAHARISIYQE